MSTTLTAVFENGVLRPTAPPDIPDGKTVRLLVLPDDPTAEEDPLLPWIGAFESGVPDAAERCDEYLGQAFHDELTGRKGADGVR